METKTLIQAGVLIGIVYVLAETTGAIGDSHRKHHKPRNPAGSVSNPRARWAQSGMGAELIASPGTAVPMVGIQSTLP